MALACWVHRLELELVLVDDPKPEGCLRSNTSKAQFHGGFMAGLLANLQSA